LNGGGAWAFSQQNYDARPSGGFGGAQIGYNAQFANWLIGLEVDIQGADIGRSSAFNFAGKAPAFSSYTIAAT
jgi:outer membrane immunogenic protein